MKLKHLLSGAAVAALVVLPVAQPGLPLGTTAVQAQEKNVSINVFFDALADYGSWVKHPEYNYVWVPNDVAQDWAPYKRGHWANTEQYGWTFVSDEPFAWAVYHYGRWGYDQDLGWFWVPGTVWAPAWVSWRRGNDFVGWAPLPPEGQGYAVNVEVPSAEPPRGYWHFVPSRDFLASDLETVVIRDERPYEETQIVGPVVVENNIVVNNVIDVDYVQQATGRQVETTRVEVVDDPTQAERRGGRNEIFAVRAPLAAPAEDAAPPRAVEANQVRARTVGQDVETTSSVKPAEQQPNGEAAPGAGQATGGRQAGEQQQPGAGAAETAQPKAAPGTAGKNAARGEAGQQGTQQVRPEDKAARGATEGETGGTAEQKRRKGTARAEQPGSATTGATEEQAQQPNAGKRRLEQGGAQDQTRSGQAPNARQERSNQAQGAGEEQGQTSSQRRLKTQPGAESPEQGAQEREQTGEAQKPAQRRQTDQAGSASGDGQAASGRAASQEQGAAAKGPRLKQAEGQQAPSREQTGAIPKAKGGGEQAPPKAAAPDDSARKPQGCSAAQQAAGSC